MAKVREAAPAEVERVLGMYEWLFAPPGSVPPRWDAQRARAAIAQAIEDPESAVLIAEHRGDLLGLCTAYLDMNSVRFGPRCWVEDLAVSPDQRSQGVGKALLDAAKDWARHRGATHLELDSSDARADAHRFYEREGPSWTSRCFAWEL
ncbi:MAG TPA: GNAT family N-acetyltransferase [Solirubrobacterales bacterium]|jgi:GNAT superfamily N-acetyltransferase|nr:GNAT family N-acetyltransferase [Solirubrobacterales bacterium]